MKSSHHYSQKSKVLFDWTPDGKTDVRKRKKSSLHGPAEPREQSEKIKFKSRLTINNNI